jgi:hypothetical protein
VTPGLVRILLHLRDLIQTAANTLEQAFESNAHGAGAEKLDRQGQIADCLAQLVRQSFLPLCLHAARAGIVDKHLHRFGAGQHVNGEDASMQAGRNGTRDDEDARGRADFPQPVQQILVAVSLEVVEDYQRTTFLQMAGDLGAAAAEIQLRHSVAEEDPRHLPQARFEVELEFAIEPNHAAGDFFFLIGGMSGGQRHVRLADAPLPLEDDHASAAQLLAKVGQQLGVPNKPLRRHRQVVRGGLIGRVCRRLTSGTLLLCR